MDERQLVGKVMAVLAEEKFECKLERLVRLLKRYDIARFKKASRLEAFLDKFPGNFDLSDYDDSTVVLARTNLAVCQDHCTRSGCPGNCGCLHICKFFLLSNSCTFDRTKGCQYGHQFDTHHNWQLLLEHNLQELGEDDLRALYQIPSVRRNSEALIPQWCKFYNSAQDCSKSGDRCGNLHLCSFYLTNQCKFGQRCWRSHDLQEEDVRKLLQRYGISVSRPIRDVALELQYYHSRSMFAGDSPVRSARSPPPLRPRQRSGSVNNLASPSLAAFCGARPKQPTSRPSSQRSRSLQRGPPQKGASAGRQRSQSRGLAREDREASTQICVHNLQGRCLFQENCRHHHTAFVYQWQVQREQQTSWMDLDADANTEVEKTFCICEKEDCFVDNFRGTAGKVLLHIIFTAMTAVDESKAMYRVRRLSTPSSVSSVPPSLQPWVTEWRWYFQESKKWTLYGTPGQDGHRASLSSREIEQKFDENPAIQLKFSTKAHNYVLDFGSMVQTNVSAATQRHVRRRPMFGRPEDIERRTGLAHRRLREFRRPLHRRGNPRTASVSATLDHSSDEDSTRREETDNTASNNNDQNGKAWQECEEEEEEAELKTSKENHGRRHDHGVAAVVPESWSVAARAVATELLLSSLHRLEEVPPTSPDYQDVAKRFCETMKRKAVITKIQRVETGELWLSYDNKRKQMERKAGGKKAEEELLFHGTRSDLVPAITKQGFDFRLSGSSSGTLYGKGSYFARDAKYSDNYCDRSSSRKMFLVRVLPGEFTQGSSSYTRPPPKSPKDPTGDLYDSCVDDVSDPSIFVVFSLDQVYPQYLISYVPFKL